MRRAHVILPALALLHAAPAAAAPPPGAASCTGCHPRSATNGPVPSLDGQPAGQIVAAMLAFRSGERPSTVMTRIAKGFTDEETRAIAEYFAAHFAAAGNAPAQP
ncbi:cytochrome c [Ancylobacter sp. IITR112]|uniref:c-type cytochrome n=1 Tax=Ancylobacter sp. IITR112 TaxID=3138073 RepID=UPI00352ABEED